MSAEQNLLPETVYAVILDKLHGKFTGDLEVIFENGEIVSIEAYQMPDLETLVADLLGENSDASENFSPAGGENSHEIGEEVRI